MPQLSYDDFTTPYHFSNVTQKGRSNIPKRRIQVWHSQMAVARSDTSQLNQRNITVACLPYTYFHLTLVHSLDRHVVTSLDLITVRTYLDSALRQYLGLSGTAVPIDIIKVEDLDVWIRLPREDSGAVQGAISQWVGKDGNISWRLKGHSEFVNNVKHGDGIDLFQ